MKNLLSYCVNIFSSGITATDLHLKLFTEDHLVKISHYNTSGQYDNMYNDTQAAFTAFENEFFSEHTNKSLQKSRTLSVDIIIKDFKSEIGHIEKVIGTKFYPNTPEYEQFFPHKLTEYRRATKSTIESLLLRLKSVVAAHASSFTVEFVASIADFLARYTTARSEQLAKMVDVHAFILTTAAARHKLEMQITKNLHTLAIEFWEKPELTLKFFDQSLLRSYKHPSLRDENKKD